LNHTKGKGQSDKILPRKKIDNVKIKYSLQKKNINKHNQVFVKEFNFGLCVCFEATNTDVIDNNPEVAEELGIIKFKLFNI
jgi:hypothetical protein